MEQSSRSYPNKQRSARYSQRSSSSSSYNQSRSYNHRSSRPAEGEQSSQVTVGSKIYQRALQMRERFLELAKESTVAGDRVAAEGHYQYADHYSRIVLEAHEQARDRRPASHAPSEAFDSVPAADVPLPVSASLEGYMAGEASPAIQGPTPRYQNRRSSGQQGRSNYSQGSMRRSSQGNRGGEHHYHARDPRDGDGIEEHSLPAPTLPMAPLLSPEE